LNVVYPEYNWKPWLFGTVPKGYWKDDKNQRQFFFWLAEILNIEHPEDLCLLQRHHFENYGGGSLFNTEYGGSLRKALMTLFPNYEWHEWLFEKTMTPGFWDDLGNQRKYLDWFSKNRLKMKSMEDWYHVDWASISNQIAVFITTKYGGSIWKFVS
jgi:hypothetical protein